MKALTISLVISSACIVDDPDPSARFDAVCVATFDSCDAYEFRWCAAEPYHEGQAERWLQTWVVEKCASSMIVSCDETGPACTQGGFIQAR